MFAEMDQVDRHRVWGQLISALQLVSDELAGYEEISVWSGPAATVRSWRAQHLRSLTDQLSWESRQIECGG